jgi:hypothetical protein
MLALAVPAIDTTLAITAASASNTSLKVAQQAANFGQKVKEFVRTKVQWAAERADRQRQHLQNHLRSSFQFTQSLKAASAFYPLATLAATVLGVLNKPLEFVMLVIAMVIMSVVFLVYTVFSIPPFNFAAFGVYFAGVHLVPLAGYTAVVGGVLAVVTMVCLLLAVINVITGGALKGLVLCQQDPGIAWYSTPNDHLGNRWQRAGMCSRPCAAGFVPSDDDGGRTCVRRGTLSFCPHAQVMRLYTDRKTPATTTDYQDLGGWRDALSSPDERRRKLMHHYLVKREQEQDCARARVRQSTVPLAICQQQQHQSSSMRQACAQAFCTSGASSNPYAFCAAFQNSTSMPSSSSGLRRAAAWGAVAVATAGLVVAATQVDSLGLRPVAAATTTK